MPDHAPDTPAPPRDGEGSVTVVGTAHVSQDSVDEVERVIEDERPDIVAVELDEGRYNQLKGNAPEDLEAADLIRGNTVFQFLAYWMLSYVQTRLGERFDVEPGADMLAGIETAERLGLGVALVDREIQTTVQRFWARLTFTEKLSMLLSLVAELDDPRVVGPSVGVAIGTMAGMAVQAFVGPLFAPETAWAPGLLPTLPTIGGMGVWLADVAIVAGIVTLAIGVPLMLVLQRFATAGDVAVEEFDIEDLTDTDVVTAMMEEFRRFSPGGAEALIDERDAFIGHKLVALRDAGYDVVAVVGAGHRAGIEGYLEDPDSLPPMESLVGRESTSRISVYKVIGYAISLGFVTFFVLLILGGASQRWLLQLFAAWFLVNGLMAGGLAKLAGSRWPSALAAGGSAWLTSINPLLAPGWFAGYVELRYESVNVGDISTMNEILNDEEAPIPELISRLREVPLFRLMLIVGLANVGSMVAGLVIFPAIFPWLSAPIGGVDAVGETLVRGAVNGAELVWATVQ